ncbi:MFS transporter [Burkholderia diffusa]|uniref:MFS transporter n=1 Tax=Burkholderia diffusa TaxID=488732 RepID=A0AAW3PA28_9BURK|nr:MFS transporter [Burkholderia diffusa]KWF32778.1 MFS transporter [Burkholderia diffusa]KWF38700.1 MFS transporter [Burkholderia diffusa]KWF46745.1 MFS transporter [Burkholderia diffusa]KWF50684.1 MFS transporter [Burkholderia diffusa]
MDRNIASPIENTRTEPMPAHTATSGTSAYRWFALFIVWFAFLLGYVGRAAWSTVAAPVGSSLGIDVALLGAFLTAFYAGYVFANVIAGVLTDLFGARAMMTFALLPLGLLTAYFGETRSLSEGIAIQVAMGIAAGADYAAGVKIISAWFTHDRGRAMGIYTTATSLAVVLANATVPAFSAQYGWSNAFRIIGAVTFVWGIVALIWLRNGTVAKVAHTGEDWREMFGLLRNRNLIALAIAGCAGLWGTIGFTAWGNALMTKQHGVSPVVAGSIIALFGVGALLSKPILGWLSDIPQVSRKYVSVGCFIAFAGTLTIYGQCTTIQQFYLVAPFLGAFSYGYLPVLIAQITDASGKKLAGASAGWTNAVWQSGSAMSPLIVGQVYGATHSFNLAFLTLAAGPIVAIVAMLFVTKK